MNNLELASKCENIAKNYKTLYVMGCIGNPMTSANKVRYTNNHPYNKKDARKEMINDADENTWGFDCVCLIKAILWGWSGNKSKAYGGAKYSSNGVPDINADSMIEECTDLSTDFSKIEIGEAVWLKGHIGVYIGDGLAVECTPSWKNGVQITSCNCSKSGFSRRNWKKHGKLPYITYEAQRVPDLYDIAKEVISGKYGNGLARKKNLQHLGYDYEAVQKEVNRILKGESLEKIAREVILGKYGNGTNRKKNLESLGYDYKAVQNEVNRILKEEKNA